jgi:3-phosphoshikimate 1-carboxyvinyltransferase
LNLILKKSTLSGEIKAPSSKSMTHRAIIASSLAKGKSSINSPLISEDTNSTLKALSMLGAQIREKEHLWEIKGGNLHATNKPLKCKESGTTLRLLTGLCSIVEGCSTLTYEASLARRPMDPLIRALKHLGVKIEGSVEGPPIKIHGGSLKGGIVEIRGDISSQFISALLMAAPYALSQIDIHVTTPLESKPYVELTLDTMRHHGVNVIATNDLRYFSIPVKEYTPKNTKIEGDYSSSANLLAAGALSGTVTVSNLLQNSKQGDIKIIDILEKMGVKIRSSNKKTTTFKSRITGIKAELSDTPDLFPIVCALSSVAQGESILTGLGRLKHKESNRVSSMMEGLKKMGADITQDGDAVIIKGRRLKGTRIRPFNDHRISMAFGVLGLVAEGRMVIENAECVAKSYPRFWRDLESIGMKMVRKYE